MLNSCHSPQPLFPKNAEPCLSSSHKLWGFVVESLCLVMPNTYVQNDLHAGLGHNGDLVIAQSTKPPRVVNLVESDE